MENPDHHNKSYLNKLGISCVNINKIIFCAFIAFHLSPSRLM